MNHGLQIYPAVNVQLSSVVSRCKQIFVVVVFFGFFFFFLVFAYRAIAGGEGFCRIITIKPWFLHFWHVYI